MQGMYRTLYKKYITEGELMSELNEKLIKIIVDWSNEGIRTYAQIFILAFICAIILAYVFSHS